VCCKAMTLDCVSCAEGLTATEYCAKNEDSSLCAKTTTEEPTTTTPRPCPVQGELLCPNNVAPVCGEPTILFPGCELPSCQCPEPTAASTAAGSPDSTAAPTTASPAGSADIVVGSANASIASLAVDAATAAFEGKGCTEEASDATDECSGLYVQLQELRLAAAQEAGGAPGKNGAVLAETETPIQDTEESTPKGADADATKPPLVVKVSVAKQELEEAKASFEAAGCATTGAVATRTECAVLQTSVAEAEASYNSAKAAAGAEGMPAVPA